MGTNADSVYTIGPLDQALSASTGYPILNMFFDATKNLPATNFMAAILLITFMASTIGGLTAASRQSWAFARSHGLPFSKFLAPVYTLFFASIS
jgi:choline transport protein